MIGIPIQMRQKLTLNFDESKKYVFIRFGTSEKDGMWKCFFNLVNWKIPVMEAPKTMRVTTELLQNTTIVPKIEIIFGFGIHAMALYPSRM